jgi:hypothetical protein
VIFTSVHFIVKRPTYYPFIGTYYIIIETYDEIVVTYDIFSETYDIYWIIIGNLQPLTIIGMGTILVQQLPVVPLSMNSIVMAIQ